MNGWAILAVGVVLWFMICGGTRSASGHYASGSRRHVAYHEARHYVAAYQVGGHVSEARIYGSEDNTGGIVRARGIPNAEAELVFLYAGGNGEAEGSGDRSAIRHVLREIPPSQRSRVVSRAQARARNLPQGKVERVANKLMTKGRA